MCQSLLPHYYFLLNVSLVTTTSHVSASPPTQFPCLSSIAVSTGKAILRGRLYATLQFLTRTPTAGYRNVGSQCRCAPHHEPRPRPRPLSAKTCPAIQPPSSGLE